jgi:hypothetical protein
MTPHVVLNNLLSVIGIHVVLGGSEQLRDRGRLFPKQLTSKGVMMAEAFDEG